MSNKNNGIETVDDVIAYLRDIYAFYYNDRNNKIGSQLAIKGFSEDGGKAYDNAMNQIATIISNINKVYEEYNKINSSRKNYVFSNDLEKKAKYELIRNVFIEFCKLEDINVIQDLTYTIKSMIEKLKESWNIDNIIVSTWKDFLGNNNDEAYRRLIEENEALKKEVEALSSKKKVATVLGYIPAYPIQNEFLLQESNNE